MNETATQTLQVDLHRLEPRFAYLRVRNDAKVNAMARSIERDGQQSPVIGVPFEEENRWLLIDGYLRLEALRRAGEDLIWVDIWNCSEQDALLAFLADCQSRHWEPIEEAALIQDLNVRLNQSLRDIARRMGRDVSWVSRRLSMIKELPEDLLDGVRQGHLSAWAASRIMVPLARANREHAQILFKCLTQEKLSTRELQLLFQHYQNAPRASRERMIRAPALFLKALHARENEEQAETLQEGPEGQWFKDLRITGHILQRLSRRVPLLFGPNQEPGERNRLNAAFEETKARVEGLEAIIQRYHPHDFPRKETEHSDTEAPRGFPARDFPNSEDLSEHGAASDQKPRARNAPGQSPPSGSHATLAGTPATMSG